MKKLFLLLVVSAAALQAQQMQYIPVCSSPVLSVATCKFVLLSSVLVPGPKGDPGAAATIAIDSVTTLPAGSPATVQNIGTPNAAVLQFGIPAGNNGADGAPGKDGATGPAGPPWVPPAWFALTPNATGTAGTVKVTGSFMLCDPSATKCPQWVFAPVQTSVGKSTLVGTPAPPATSSDQSGSTEVVQ